MSDDKLFPVRGLWNDLYNIRSSSPYAPPDPHKIADRVYRDQTFVLDGYTFTNCAFINCTLQTRKANFILRSCFLQNCTIYFEGSALRAVKLASLIVDFPDIFKPHIDNQGAVTI